MEGPSHSILQCLSMPEKEEPLLINSPEFISGLDCVDQLVTDPINYWGRMKGLDLQGSDGSGLGHRGPSPQEEVQKGDDPPTVPAPTFGTQVPQVEPQVLQVDPMKEDHQGKEPYEEVPIRKRSLEVALRELAQGSNTVIRGLHPRQVSTLYRRAWPKHNRL